MSGTFALRALMLPILAGACIAQAEPGSVSLELREEVTLKGSFYRLADVAELAGDTELVQALGMLEIGRVPRPGYWADITRQQIAARIEREMPEMHSRITWKGDAVLRVGATGIALEGREVSAFAERALHDAIALRHDEFEIEQLEPMHDIVVPSGGVSLSAAELDGERLRKRMPVWVDIAVDGQHQRSVPIWFRVSAWEDVVTAARDLDRHHVLVAEDLLAATLDVTTLRDEAVEDIDAVIGKRLVLPLSAGNVVAVDSTQSVPAVQEGALVEVLALAGRVSLTAKAQALADGEINDQIPVRSLSSGQRYLATVVAPGYLQAN